MDLIDVLIGIREAQREVAGGIFHVPGTRGADGRADVRLDAVNGTEPVGVGKEQRAVLLALERCAGAGGNALQVESDSWQLMLKATENPGERQVGRERRRHELVGGVCRKGAEVIVEEVVPRADPELDGRVGRKLPSRAAFPVAIHDDDALDRDGAGALSAEQLARVESAVASAAENDEAHTQACPLAAAAAASRSLKTLRFVEWPGLTRAFGSMKWTALFTAMQASPKPVAMSSSFPA